MTDTIADCRKLVQVAVGLAAALLAFSASRLPAQAQTTQHMLVIPASDGYGFDDCLGGNKACGRVIADAWCEAHGMSASVSFGRSEDITASIPAADTQARPQTADVAGLKLTPGSFVVSCKD